MKQHKPDSTISHIAALLRRTYPGWLAAHEVGHALYSSGIAASENACATRLNSLEREGGAISRFRDGKRYKEWCAHKSEQMDLL